MVYNGGEFLLSGDLCIDDILSLVQGNSLATDDPAMFIQVRKPMIRTMF